MITTDSNILRYERELKERVKGDVSFSDTSRALYATAACMYKMIPSGVVFPKSAADVAEVVRYAAENNLSVTGRGSGSSLAGQAVNSGIILDFSRYMNRIIGYDAQTETVRVQPGVVYGALNRYLKQFSRVLPPDPSSGQYCTVGGMVANNAAGAHSVKYGFTIDYIHSLEVVLASGEMIRTQSLSTDSPAFQTVCNRDTHESRLISATYRLLSEHEPLIRKHTPGVRKIASGYRLERTLHKGQLDLGKLFCGSEGTLGLITEITFKVAPIPRFQKLVVVNFDTLEKAADLIEPLLEMQPAAVEMMEKKAMDLVRDNRPDLRSFFPEGIESQVYVEFDGSSEQNVAEATRELIRFLEHRFPQGMSYNIAETEFDRAELWKVRKASFPLVYQKKRPEKVPAFIEDFVVPPGRIAEYIRFVYSVYETHGTEAIILGHAGDGNFHIRPFIDFSKEADLQLMRVLMDEISEKVLEMGGAISGEHGDGRVRARLLLKQAGPLWQVYKQVKDLFDPEGILNPDVKISEKDQLNTNLRFSPQYTRKLRPTLLHFQEDNFYYEIEKCHGCSACHQSNVTTTMCPVFQITADELASPRGKANILQNLIARDLPDDYTQEADFKQMLDYCIYCEGCYVECPSHVDVGRLLQEHKARYRAEHGATLMQRALEHSETLSSLQSFAAPLTNALNSWKPARLLMEYTLGIDHRRPLPKAASARTFRKLNRTRDILQPRDKVVLFHDLFARYNRPELTRLAIRILQSFQIQVVSLPLGSAGMPAIVYGNLKLARRTISKSKHILAHYVNKGFTIISTEPTAALALRKEWVDVDSSAEVRSIAAHTFEFFDYVQAFLQRNKINPEFKPVEIQLAYHAPCHLKALQVGRPGVELLRLIPGVRIREIDRGCCGIAGTYGFKKGKHGYDASMQIGKALFEDLKNGPEHEKGLSECSTCRLQMEHGSGKEVLHPIEILARSLKIRES